MYPSTALADSLSVELAIIRTYLKSFISLFPPTGIISQFIQVSRTCGQQRIASKKKMKWKIWYNEKMIKEYKEYLKDNPQGYWFRARLYGWGWTPATWQGWLVLAIWFALVLFFAFTIDENSPAREVAFTFILPVLLLTATLLRICYKKGERPRWQWGPSK